MIKGIIFDFGNVIKNFDNKIFAKKISEYSDKPAEEIYNLIYNKSNLTELFEAGKINSKEFIEKVSHLCSLNISEKEFIEAYSNIFTANKSVIDLIKKLKKKYKLGLLSNTNEIHFNKVIKKIEVFDLLDAVSLSFKIGSMKPDEEIFKDCLKKLNLKAIECIYIDDIKKYSEKAAEMGIIGVHFTSFSELKKALNELEIEF